LPLLQAEGVGVTFGGIRALEGVDLSVDSGTINGLIGPNGAGKTTMFNVICGLQEVAEGRVHFEERDVSVLKTHERARLGIARTFQRLEVFGSLSARDNIRVAAEIRNGWASDRIDPEETADALLETVNLRAAADQRVDTMSTGLARLVEIGRALALRPRLLLLDEATSGLNEEETDLMAQLLERLVAEGLAVLLVEHDIEFVMRLCSRIYVLDFGKLIAAGVPSEIQANEAVQAAYLGAPSEGAA
jgi:branched-chain amino acid transport system ATP-binding protein